MDSFEINKIITAVLLVVLLVFGVGKISDLVFEVKKPNIDGYKVEVNKDITKVLIVHEYWIIFDIFRNKTL